MNNDFEPIIRDIKNKIYHPVYLLFGEESYYIDLISDYIEEHILDDMSKEFNQTVYYGRDIDRATLLSTVKRYPMMSDYQVVIVKEAQDIRDLTKEEDNPLFNYFQNPLKSTILVLNYKYKSVDKRTKFYKVIAKNAVMFETKKLYDNQVPGWVAQYLKRKNYTITEKASQLIADYIGSDLARITNELQKLMLNVKEGTEITPLHIEQNIGISKDFNIFELQDAIGNKDHLKTNRIVNYFAANPKENPMVLTMSNLYSYFSKLLVYHSLPDKSKPKVATALGINPFFADKYIVASKNYSGASLLKIIGVLREFDLKSKGIDNTGTPDGELLQEMMYKIMH